jgi:hypothetical protein
VRAKIENFGYDGAMLRQPGRFTWGSSEDAEWLVSCNLCHPRSHWKEIIFARGSKAADYFVWHCGNRESPARRAETRRIMIKSCAKRALSYCAPAIRDIRSQAFGRSISVNPTNTCSDDLCGKTEAQRSA